MNRIACNTICKVTEGSGLDSNRIGTVITSRGMSQEYIKHIDPGRFYLFDSKREAVLVDRYRGTLFVMFRERLQPVEQLMRKPAIHDTPMLPFRFSPDNDINWKINIEHTYTDPAGLVLVYTYQGECMWVTARDLDNSCRIQLIVWTADGMRLPEREIPTVHRLNIKAIKRFEDWEPYNEEQYGRMWFYGSELAHTK